MATLSDLVSRARAHVHVVSLEELRRRLEADEALVLVDVREVEELASGMLPGAISIPRGVLELRAPSLLPDRARRIVTYCALGSRSLLAAQTLRDLGYEHVESAEPGFTGWQERGYPIQEHGAPRGGRRLDGAARARYARHLLLPEIGEAGQLRLSDARVLVVGAGGLGSPVALYLAAAGVGTLGVIDADRVEMSNLQRQPLHSTHRVGWSKVKSASAAIHELNPDVSVEAHEARLTSANVERVVSAFDLVVDGSDNFPTRYLVNDASVWLGKAVVHGSVSRFDGQVTTFLPARAAGRFGLTAGPCYRCLYPEPPAPHLAPNCQEAGVLGVLPGVVGLLQATETLKLLLGIGSSLVGRLMTYDSLGMRFREVRLRPSPECPVCGPAPTITSYVDYEAFCATGG